MPDIQDRITAVLHLLHDALDAGRQRVGDDEPVLRYAVYLLAREELDGRVREIVWTEPPFPEYDDISDEEGDDGD
jgi:hypothetical protein